MSKRANFFAIGVFVISACVIAIAGIIVFGSGTLHKRTATIVATFKGTTNGLREGAKVKAYGVEVGLVRDILLHRIEETGEVVIPVLLEIDLNHVSSLLGIDSLTDENEMDCLRALERDAHATLQLESFVTGLLYVEIIFGDMGNGYILYDERFAEYRAIPTLPTDMQEFLSSLQSIARNLGDTDFAGLVNETKTTVVDLRQQFAQLNLKGTRDKLDLLIADTHGLISNPELKTVIEDLANVLRSLTEISETVALHADGTFTKLDSTLTELEAAATFARTWMDPSNSLYSEVMGALDQIGDAARSMRILVQYLERNPNAILTGKPSEEPAQ